ncbi:hypothetical protein Ddye_012375, partial [Dipteronia dyeriana]
MVIFRASWLTGISPQFILNLLSLLLGLDKPQKAVLLPIADKILFKFAKWKGKFLYLANRATLIRSGLRATLLIWFNFFLLVLRWFLRGFVRHGSYIFQILQMDFQEPTSLRRAATATAATRIYSTETHP